MARSSKSLKRGFANTMEREVTLSPCTKTVINYNLLSPSSQHHASNILNMAGGMEGRIDQRLLEFTYSRNIVPIVGVMAFMEYCLVKIAGRQRNMFQLDLMTMYCMCHVVDVACNYSLNGVENHKGKGKCRQAEKV